MQTAARNAPALLLHCRPGFENECAAEIQARAAAQGVHGYCRARARDGYVVFQPSEPEAAARLMRRLAFEGLVFARQWFVSLALLTDLPPSNRVAPLLDALQGLPGPAGDLFLETPDTDEAKALGRLLRSLARPMEAGLGKDGLMRSAAAAGAPRIHVCFLNGHTAHVGYADPANSAPWPMGIPRLRLARQAPSRAALKLEEALLRFLGREATERALRPGMTAVDLGAAPGGWSWVLARHHLRVSAVDNGPLDPRLLDTGLVEHLRADAFAYRPVRPVDWMVCDVVESPSRIARLAAQWITEGLCRHSIFNLKLPMKRRYHEVQRCMKIVSEALEESAISYQLRCKHLYHDREEVTAYAARLT